MPGKIYLEQKIERHVSQFFKEKDVLLKEKI